MGLIPDDTAGANSRVSPTLLLPAIVVGLSGLLALLGDIGRTQLRYDRTAIADGEWWRLVSGHFVHLSSGHYVLNALALLLIFWLYASFFSVRQWLLLTLVSIAAIDAGFAIFDPSLSWYVGLSGVLHGLLAAGAVAAAWQGRWEGWLMLVLLIGKIAFEQLVGPLPGSVQSTGGPVIVAAHLYGALAGLVVAAALLFRNARTAPI